MNNQYTTDEFVKILQASKFVIYGAGFWAQRFYDCLKKLGCENNVIAFAVTEQCNNGDKTLFDKEIKLIENIDCNQKIIIAAHNNSTAQMKKTLDDLNFCDYIMLYPYLVQMELGTPIKTNQEINVCEFISQMPDIYYMTIIYMAIENYFHKNDNGDELYIKMQSEYTDINTAVRRLKALHNKISKYSEDIALNDVNVKLNMENNVIIDGNHRMALAKYFNIERIFADIYDVTMDEYLYVYNKAIFSLEKIKSVFNSDEVNQIIKADERMRKRY